MNFYIITPSYNQLDFLKRCIASVRDQVAPEAQRSEDRRQRTEDRGRKTEALISDLPPPLKLWRTGRSPISENESLIRVHHHIQDGSSTDGTREFLEKLATVDGSSLLVDGDSETLNNGHSAIYQLSFISEADEGMYDAINKGVDLVSRGRMSEDGGPSDLDFNGLNERSDSTISTGNRDDSIIAWLNCDEQYLPGTLEKAADFFQHHPQVDILFGGMLMVDEAGSLLACRKAMPMRRAFLEASYLYNFSCAMFFRASLWENVGKFDPSFKNVGDEEWVRRAIQAGAQTAVIDDYLATFTYGQKNLSSDPAAVEEHERLKGRNSRMINGFKVPINLLRSAEKVIRGGHRQKGPLKYEIYQGDLSSRKAFVCEAPTCRWPDEPGPYLFRHRLG